MDRSGWLRRALVSATVAIVAVSVAAPAASARPLDTRGPGCITHPASAGRSRDARIRDDVARRGPEELTSWIAAHPRLMYAASRARFAVTVPVAFHVIRKDKTRAGGNVSKRQVLDQIQVLNDAYGGRTGGARTGFRFELVSLTRTTKSSWFHVNGYGTDLAMKTALKEGGPETLNIYSAKLGGNLLGYAYLAEDADEVGVLDGVVIHFQSLPGGSFDLYDEGDTERHAEGGERLHVLQILSAIPCQRPRVARMRAR